LSAPFDAAGAPGSEAKASPAPSARRAVRLSHRLEYAALRGFVAIMRVLPLEVASCFNGWLWGALAPHLSRQRRADRHLTAMAPELSAAERRRILLAMWRNLGQTFIEAMQLDRIAAEPDRIELDAPCREIVRRTVAEGGIVAGAHLGNWEAGAAPFAAAGGREVGVYQSVTNPLVDAYLFKVRAPYYKGGLLAKGDGAARGLARQARQGGPILQMADLRDETGVPVPFFGRLAPSTPAPAMLARRFGRPLFAVVLLRVATCRFRMQAVEIEVPRSADRAADIREATAKIQSAFEGWIRRWPEQWMWAHGRYEYDKEYDK
jgi:KDO2-lipid IV(A) lauroyltransferase